MVDEPQRPGVYWDFGQAAWVPYPLPIPRQPDDEADQQADQEADVRSG